MSSIGTSFPRDTQSSSFRAIEARERNARAQRGKSRNERTGWDTLHCPTMLRPQKKYSVYDLRQLKGKRCLTHVHVKSPEEAAAAEAAGIDLLSCSFDTPASQARLPLLVEAAPKSFISGATPHGLASPEEAIRIAFLAF